MKKNIFILFVCMLFTVKAWGQTAETEPNNAVADGGVQTIFTGTYAGTVTDGGDNDDVWKIAYPNTGTIEVTLTATVVGGGAPQVSIPVTSYGPGYTADYGLAGASLVSNIPTNTPTNIPLDGTKYYTFRVNLSAASGQTVNYTITIKPAITGNTEVGGATITWADSGPQTTTSDGAGNYTAVVSNNWTGTITPSKTGYTFTPTFRSYAAITTPQTNQDFSAPITISGNTGVSGTTLSWSDGTAKTATTDGAGNYSITVSYNWSGTVTPSKPGFLYTFTPASKTYANVTADKTNENYTGEALQLISPVVTSSWSQGASENITWSSSGFTNIKLEYSLDGGTNWSTIIASTPASAGSYSWTVPSTPTSNALIKMTDVSNAAITQTSGAFTIKLTAPSLLSPTDNAAEVSRDPILTWSSVKNSSRYNLLIATDNYFTSVLVQKQITDTSYQLTTSLNAGTKYYWKASGVNSQGNAGDYATPNSFTTGGTLPVELTDFSANVKEDKVGLSWSTATEVSSYGFEVQRSEVSNQQSAESWIKVGFVPGAGNSNSPRQYTFTDQPTGGTNFSYRLKQIDNNGNYKYYDAITVALNTKQTAELMQNNPNPFNPSTSIKFYIPQNSDVAIKIYDMLGREVTTLINKQTTAGYHIVYWNGRDRNGASVASGVYIYRLVAGQFVETKKMLMMK